MVQQYHETFGTLHRKKQEYGNLKLFSENNIIENIDVNNFEWLDTSGVGVGISGVGLQEEGTTVGALATTLNFVGSAVEVTGAGATKEINITAGGAADSDKLFCEKIELGDGEVREVRQP